MEELLDALAAEARELLNTISVIRVLKPIQRQVPECESLLRGRVECLLDIVEPAKVPADPLAQHPAPGGGVDLTGSSGIGPAAQGGPGADS